MRKLILVIIAFLATMLAVVMWLLGDANRFKPDLARAASDHLGLEVELRGDLDWGFWPPFRIIARDIRISRETPAGDAAELHIQGLSLDAEARPLLSLEPRLIVQSVVVDGASVRVREGDVAESGVSSSSVPLLVPLPLPASADERTAPWRLETLTVSNLEVDYAGPAGAHRISVPILTVTDVSPSRIGAFDVRLIVDDTWKASVSAGVDAASLDKTRLDVALTGPNTDLTVSGTIRADVRTRSASGSFRAAGSPFTGDVDLSVAARKRPLLKFNARLQHLQVPSVQVPSVQVPSVQIVAMAPSYSLALAGIAPTAVERLGPVVPVGVLRNVDWQGTITIGELDYAGRRFEDVSVATGNVAAKAQASIDIARLHGGSGNVHVEIDATRDPLAWRVTPDLRGLEAAGLMTELGSDFAWQGPIDLAGSFTMRGNTRRELAETLAGHADLDSRGGVLDVRAVKSSLLPMATLLGDPERIRAWPDDLRYVSLTGRWNVDDRHELTANLDNLELRSTGSYDVLANMLDLDASVLFVEKPEHASFDVDPRWTGLPIPLHCEGPIAKPDCAVDEAEARRLVGRVLTGSANEGLKADLERKIDEHVPEEYRQTARSILEALGRALEGGSNESSNGSPNTDGATNGGR